jgi:hypothetical protein
MLVARFSSEPINDAILPANSARSSRTRFGRGEAFLLSFFTGRVRLSLRRIDDRLPDILMIFHITRELGNKLEGSGYRFHSI